ncbi:MAG: hypothetical protein K2X37_07605 [Chitinophagaceae bacterium]|nr:hypothetical protein [Chitinophagaceae bacterium]
MSLIASCKKTDIAKINDQKSFDSTKVADAFFEYRDSIHAEILSVINDIKSSERNSGFITQLAKVNGFPVWEKSIGTFSSRRKIYVKENEGSYVQGNTVNESNSDFISFIPLRDTTTNEILSYIFCDKSPKGFTYRIYNKKSILQSKPKSLHDLDNKGMQLAIYSFFEKELNKKSRIEFNTEYNFNFKDVSVKFEANGNSQQNQLNANSSKNNSQIKKNEVCTKDGFITIQFSTNPCSKKYYFFYTCYGGVRNFYPSQSYMYSPCGKTLEPEELSNGGLSTVGISNLFLLSAFYTSTSQDIQNISNNLGAYYTGNEIYQIPDNWQIDYNTLWMPTITERGGGDPTQKYNYLNNKIADVTLRNLYKISYAQVEWEFYNQPIDEFTDMSSSEFFESLATGNYSSFPTPITILLKAGATGTAELLFQIFMLRLTNPNVSSFTDAFAYINWWDVGHATAMGAFTFSNKYLDAAITGAAFALKSLYNGDSWESIGYRFLEGFLSSIAGSSFSHFINDKFAGNISTLGGALVNKFGNFIPYGKITSWMGGGLELISKSFMHNNKIINAHRIMKGFSSNKVAVIGRNMNNRVTPFANSLSSELGVPVLTWQGFNSNLSVAQNVANNRAWIKQLKSEGYTFYDLGVDPDAATPDLGEFYRMELEEVFGL